MTDFSDADAFRRLAPYYDELMATVPYTYWVKYVERLVRRFRRRPRRVVDLATGTGSVGLILAERRYQVTGVDLSAGMLAEAARKAALLGLQIELIEQDLAHLDIKQSFDLAVCLYDSLNYLTGTGDLQSCFRGVFNCLVPDGLFIFDMNTERALREELFTQNNLTRKQPFKYDWKSHYDPEAKVSRVEMRFWTPEGDEFSEVHYQRAHPIEDVSAMLVDAGFQIGGVFDAFTTSPPDETSERVHFVAIRPPQD
jgi:SAM-dependent methyltransferase